MLKFAGITAIDTRVAGVTVKLAEPVALPRAAAIVTDPWLSAVARPLEFDALLIEATLVSEELQVTKLVKICVELSVYVPVALNCWFVPLAMLGFAGVTLIETSVAGVTVNPVEPDTLPVAAVMMTDPALTPIARPWESSALLTAATAVLEEVHATEAVRFCVELSV